MRPVSLYIHVPFCKRRCSYCTFYHIDHVEHREAAFVDAAIAEVTAFAEEFGEPFECPSVFFGGGTPSVLSASAHERIFDAIGPLLAQQAEVTMETNPEDVTDELLERLHRLGVNRVSLGIQSMDPAALRLLKRCSPRVNAAAIQRVRRRFENFSVDLLLGIPGGSPTVLAGTLENVLAHEPPHVSVYCLERSGVMESQVAPFFDRVDSEQSADEYLLTCEVLRSHGYDHYEVSNFARVGRHCVHNGVYWSGADYVGIGPGAHSFVRGRRYSNPPSIERYVATSGNSRSVRQFDRRGASARLVERLMLSLRTSRGLDMRDLSNAEDMVDDLLRSELAKVCEGRLVLTDRGFLVMDEIVLRMARRVAGRLDSAPMEN